MERQATMNCFECDVSGRQEAAVGVCQACGRAVCREHSIVVELPVYRKVASGMGFRIDLLPGKRTHLLCRKCAETADLQPDYR
jgi:hypothetical protein